MTDLYQQEYARSVAKYTPEFWATLPPSSMIAALREEVEEVALSLWAGDFDGEHGTEVETVHCEIVARRIREEIKKRKEVTACPPQ